MNLGWNHQVSTWSCFYVWAFHLTLTFPEEEEYEKLKAKMKDEFLSFNHHKNGSENEIFRNPGAKIIHQRQPFPYLLSSQGQLQQETGFQ